MNSPKIVLQAATSNYDPVVADLVHSTGPVSYDYIFGPDRKLLNAFIEEAWKTESLFGHTETTIATDGDTIHGIEMGYPGERYYALRDGGEEAAIALVQSGRATAQDLHAIGMRSYKNDFQLPYIPSDAYYILALAVTENSRGTGVGAKLLNDAFARAKAEGFRTLHLDVLGDNPAVDFYRRMGMTCMVESSNPELREHHKIPVEFRMVKELA